MRRPVALSTAESESITATTQQGHVVCYSAEVLYHTRLWWDLVQQSIYGREKALLPRILNKTYIVSLNVFSLPKEYVSSGSQWYTYGVYKALFVFRGILKQSPTHREGRAMHFIPLINFLTGITIKNKHKFMPFHDYLIMERCPENCWWDLRRRSSTNTRRGGEKEKGEREGVGGGVDLRKMLKMISNLPHFSVIYLLLTSMSRDDTLPAYMFVSRGFVPF